ncbi:hypothetical protein BKP37_11795 [Anaerobacillus alkalilacustris]|uniref:RNA polymerase sigma-70 region 4 domain-containing protein n=1 Tax=Anaerobacillus alkalilacustris TaxID=393763 RepID=A0A1S2LLT9_9BACI|nr:hypothetical protein [Anaerobacillus alkalilacustris]OIJ13180.1 hypothetical protein BKP37_11795 [Anaerobacillus alkalilacustris]
MLFTNLQNFSDEEIAEEFGIHRPIMEREISASIGKKKNNEREVKKDEEKKKVRSKSKDSPR